MFVLRAEGQGAEESGVLCWQTIASQVPSFIVDVVVDPLFVLLSPNVMTS